MSRIASGADGCSYEIIAMPIRITTVVTSPNRTRSEWDRLAWLSSVPVCTLHNTASTFRPPMICDWPVMLQLKKSKSTSNSRMTTRGGQEKRASDSRLSRCEKSGAGGAHCGSPERGSVPISHVSCFLEALSDLRELGESTGCICRAIFARARASCALTVPCGNPKIRAVSKMEKPFITRS